MVSNRVSATEQSGLMDSIVYEHREESIGSWLRLG